MKTKPFNLEEALNGAKVVTRDGREVYDVSKDRYSTTFPITAIIVGYGKDSFTQDGLLFDGEKNNADLFIVDESEDTTQQPTAFQQMYQVLRMLQEESGVSMTHQQWKQVNEAVEAAQKEQGYV